MGNQELAIQKTGNTGHARHRTKTNKKTKHTTPKTKAMSNSDPTKTPV
jgi:hypothetical protein